MQWLELKVPPLLVWLVIAGAMLAVAHSAPSLSFTLVGRSAINGPSTRVMRKPVLEAPNRRIQDPEPHPLT